LEPAELFVRYKVNITESFLPACWHPQDVAASRTAAVAAVRLDTV
jgi:hypothetical protein